MANQVDMSSFGRAGEAFKFVAIGDTFKGEIVGIKEPRMMPNPFNDTDELTMIITCRLADGDDRAIYVKLDPYSSMGGAIAAATDEHGGKLEIGGTLAVQFTEELDTGKGRPAKIYVAAYKPPVQSVDVASATKPDLLADTPNVVGPADDMPF